MGHTYWPKMTADDLDIPTEKIYAWCDSSVVIGWLNRPPPSLKVFVANRVVEIDNHIPTSQWRHVATDQNPADLASRGILPQELEIWWQGPKWLKQSPQSGPNDQTSTKTENCQTSSLSSTWCRQNQKTYGGHNSLTWTF